MPEQAQKALERQPGWRLQRNRRGREDYVEGGRLSNAASRSQDARVVQSQVFRKRDPRTGLKKVACEEISGRGAKSRLRNVYVCV